MAIIRDSRFNTVDLNNEVKTIWERKNPNVKFSEKDTSSDTMQTFKFGLTIDIEDAQPHEIIAEGLVNQAIDLLKGVSDEPFTSYITTESIALNEVIQNSPAGINNCLTAYYTGNPNTNPTEITAWLVLRGTFPDVSTEREHVMIDGENTEMANGRRIGGR